MGPLSAGCGETEDRVLLNLKSLLSPSVASSADLSVLACTLDA